MFIPEEEVHGFFRYIWFINHIQQNSKESGSLVIIPQSKIIINIEVKYEQGFNSLKLAACQTNKNFSFFKKIYGTFLSAEWKFVKAVCTSNLVLTEENQPCEACKNFILHQSDLLDMKPWIERLMSYSRKYTEEIYEREYDDLLVRIIGFSSMHRSDILRKHTANPTESNNETEMKLTAQDSVNQIRNEEDRNKLIKKSL